MEEEFSVEKFLIPRRLNDGAQFFIWELDTAIIFIVTMLMFALLFDGLGLLIGAVVGLRATKLLSRLKELGGKQVVMGALYWYTPSTVWPAFKNAPISYIREYSA